MWLKRRSLKGDFFVSWRFYLCVPFVHDGEKGKELRHKWVFLSAWLPLFHATHSFFIASPQGHNFYLTFVFTQTISFFCLSARQDKLNNFLSLSSSGLEGAAGRGVKILRNESIRDRRFNLAQNVTAGRDSARMTSPLSLLSVSCTVDLTQCSYLPATPVWVLIVDECIARFAVDTNTSLGSRWHLHSLRERHCTMQLAQ